MIFQLKLNRFFAKLQLLVIRVWERGKRPVRKSMHVQITLDFVYLNVALLSPENMLHN